MIQHPLVEHFNHYFSLTTLFQWAIHGLTLLPLYPSGECSESDREQMLNSLYMATMTVCQTRLGNTGHLDPVGLVELNVHNSDNFTPRRYLHSSVATSHGFGFKFVKNPKKGLHQSRVMVLDYSRWKLRHIIHFLCK